MEPEQQQRRHARLMMRVLVGALVGWGLLLGLGAYLGLDAQTPSGDWRRLAVWGGVLGLFLAIWAAAVWLRRTRK